MKRLTYIFYIALSLCSTQLKAETYSIGVQEIIDYRPYSEIKESTYQGFNRELLDMFSQYAGYKFNYQILPLKRLNRYFLDGGIDFRYPDNSYWDKQTKGNLKISYSEPVVKYIDGVMVKKQRVGKGLNELYKLGVVLGYTPQPYQELINSKQIHVFQNSHIERLIKQVKRGQNSGIYVNIAVGIQKLKAMQEPQALVFDPDLPHIISTRHLSSIKHPKIIKQFNQFLIDKHKQIEELKTRYQVEAVPGL